MLKLTASIIFFLCLANSVGIFQIENHFFGKYTNLLNLQGCLRVGTDTWLLILIPVSLRQFYCLELHHRVTFMQELLLVCLDVSNIPKEREFLGVKVHKWTRNTIV